MIAIYQYNTTELRALVDPDDQANQQRGIMREDILTLTFASVTFIDFQIGDYATVFGILYRLNSEPQFVKSATDTKGKYQYTLTMEAPMYELGRTPFLFLDSSDKFTEARFSLRGKPEDFLNVLVSNLNRDFPGSKWQVMQYIDADYQSIDFDSQNCLQVLSTLADTFQTEYFIDGTNIYLIKYQTNTNQKLEYGKGKALYSIEQDNQDTSTANLGLVTRLYAYGSNKNIGSNYRNGAQYLRMGDSLFIEKNVNKFGLFSAIVYFDGQNQTPEIYPEYNGTVSAVTDDFTFTDAAIDFDVNEYLIAGTTAQLTFNTGQLSGYTFDIHSFDNATKTFVINTYQGDNSQTISIPSDSLKPAVGDQYVIVNILMPLKYVVDAESKLAAAAQALLNANCLPKVQYPLGCNPLYFLRTGVRLVLGGLYNLVDADSNTNANIRLVEFTRNLRQDSVYTNLTLADQVQVQPTIVKLLKGL